MTPETTAGLPGTGTFVLLVLVAGLGPVLAIIATSFLKVSVVLMLVRNALGIQNVPSNLAINSLALILSLFIMAPVGVQIAERLTEPDVELQDLGNPRTQAALVEGLQPLQGFLERHADQQHKEFFAGAAERMWANEMDIAVDPNDMIALVPAFTTSQLASAFQTAFLLFLPFIAIDLIVANVLLSLGMIMMSPLTVSLPFKLLLFVVADGWTRLLQGLVLSYQ